MTIQKSIRLSYIATALAIFLSVFATSCNETNFDEIKEIPKFEEVQPDKLITGFDFGRHFSQQKSFNWKNTDVPSDISIVLTDAAYKPVDYYFFLEFNNWFKNMQFENGVLALGDDKSSLDCDNFAMLYKSMMGVASYKNGFDIDFAVGVVVVEQTKEFGGISSGFLHMLNIVFTNRDWYIFEPQTGTFIELHKYPNQKTIKYIII